MDRVTSEWEGRRWPDRTEEGGRPRAPWRRGSDSRAGLHPGPGSGYNRDQTHRRRRARPTRLGLSTRPDGFSQKLDSRQAGVAQPAFRVQDSQFGGPAGRPKSVA